MVGSMRVRWHGRSKVSKMLIVGLVAVSASLLPAAGSFVPRDSGNVIFGGEAQAACKYGLTNKADRWWAWAQVVTNWCYDGVHVTSRHSVPSWGMKALGSANGVYYRSWDSGWKYSQCHYYNGIWNHNCLTRYQFSWGSLNKWIGPWVICIHTRIYGNGYHHRLITDGPCP